MANTYKVGITYIVYVEVDAEDEATAIDEAVQIVDTPVIMNTDQAYIICDEYTEPTVELITE